MALTADQTLTIQQLVALHGHLVDDLEVDRFGEVFTADIVYDLENLGYGTLRGADALKAASATDRDRVGHLVTNTVVTEGPDGQVRARSKALGILRDGTAGSVVYEDLLRLTPDGWRIAHRTIRATRRAAGG